MRKYILLLISLTISLCSMAQNDIRADYEAYKQQRAQEYRDFREKINADFAEYLKQRWDDCNTNVAVPAPIPDVSPKPEVAQESTSKTPHSLPEPENTVKVVKDIVTQTTPTTPTSSAKTLAVDFFGDALNVPCNKDALPMIGILNESNYASAWSTYGNATQSAVKYIEQYVTAHHINGWGCYQLVKRISEQAYGNNYSNERIALQAYLLSQLKYRAQVAICCNDLVLLLPFKETIYEVSYITLDSQKYYIYGYNYDKSVGLRTYAKNVEYAENILSVAMDGTMKIGQSKPMEFERLGAMLGQRLEAPMYMGNIALLYSYPILDNIVYYKQGLNAEFATAILAPLREKIRGKSETEAVGYLLNFVQNGFGYVDDMVVFGHQKQLFIEESFFYGQNNCKDRVGVFSWLVKELVGLDVIALRYEGNSASKGIGHITCAIAFRGDIAGDACTYQNRRYVICDPTYINAGIGQSMPCYKGSKPTILPLR
ncbi:MAG: hypothetical protein J6U93_01250 [Alistipes sp.]|nr:hypothetical protein [Alistipes sp.]